MYCGQKACVDWNLTAWREEPSSFVWTLYESSIPPEVMHMTMTTMARHLAGAGKIIKNVGGWALVEIVAGSQRVHTLNRIFGYTMKTWAKSKKNHHPRLKLTR